MGVNWRRHHICREEYARSCETLAFLKMKTPGEHLRRVTLARTSLSADDMTTRNTVFVAYYRVSTKKQGRSGLGLEAQRETVGAFVNSVGGRLVAEFTEQESGKNNARPNLQNALAACRVHRSVLIVAKLDRLARNAAFLLSLRDASVEIIAVDLPSMNRMTVGIMAVVAEEEARMISERTKVALAAARRRGVSLGSPENLSDAARKLGSHASAQSRALRANRCAMDLAPMIQQLRMRGAHSLRQLAEALNAERIPSPRGIAWTPMGVSRVLARQAASAARLQ